MPSSDILAGFCAPGEFNDGPFRAGGGNLPPLLSGTVAGPLTGDDGTFLGASFGGTAPGTGGGPVVTLTGLGLGAGVANTSLLGRSGVGLLTGCGLTACGGVSCAGTGLARLGVLLLLLLLLVPVITGCIKLNFGMTTSSSVKYEAKISVGFCAVKTAP